MATSSLDSLSDDLVIAILLALDLEDVLHLSRVNRRLHGLVSNYGEAVWQSLYQRMFGALDEWSKAGTWSERFRDRFPPPRATRACQGRLAAAVPAWHQLDCR